MKILSLLIVGLFSLSFVPIALAQNGTALSACDPSFPDFSSCLLCNQTNAAVNVSLCNACLNVPGCFYCVGESAQGCLYNNTNYTTKCKKLPTPGAIYSNTTTPCSTTSCSSLSESCTQCVNNVNCGYCVTNGNCISLGPNVNRTNYNASTFAGQCAVASLNVYNCQGVCAVRGTCGGCLRGADSTNNQPCIYCPTAPNNVICFDQNSPDPQCASNSTTNGNQCPATGSASTLSGIIFAIVAAIFISTLKNFP